MLYSLRHFRANPLKFAKPQQGFLYFLTRTHSVIVAKPNKKHREESPALSYSLFAHRGISVRMCLLVLVQVLNVSSKVGHIREGTYNWPFTYTVIEGQRNMHNHQHRYFSFVLVLHSRIKSLIFGIPKKLRSANLYKDFLPSPSTFNRTILGNCPCRDCGFCALPSALPHGVEHWVCLALSASPQRLVVGRTVRII